VRPSYRDAMIDNLAEQLRQAWIAPRPAGGLWAALAEAAVDELIDRPEREFQQQLAAIVMADQHRGHIGTWQPATVEAWL
jgi:hypothetical protein